MLLTGVLALWIAPAAAQGVATDGQAPEVQVKKLGGTTRFSPPMRRVDDLRSMANANRNHISRVLMLTLNGTGDNVTANSDETRFGADIGGGLLAFADRVGVRTDVRYFKASTNSNLDRLTGAPADVLTQAVLSGLHFWGASLGVSVRW
jgi:hypothetical protein